MHSHYCARESGLNHAAAHLGSWQPRAPQPKRRLTFDRRHLAILFSEQEGAHRARRWRRWRLWRQYLRLFCDRTRCSCSWGGCGSCAADVLPEVALSSLLDANARRRCWVCSTAACPRDEGCMISHYCGRISFLRVQSCAAACGYGFHCRAFATARRPAPMAADSRAALPDRSSGDASMLHVQA